MKAELVPGVKGGKGVKLLAEDKADGEVLKHFWLYRPAAVAFELWHLGGPRDELTLISLEKREEATG